MQFLVVLYFFIGIIVTLSIIISDKEDVLETLHEDGVLITIVTALFIVITWPVYFLIGCRSTKI